MAKHIKVFPGPFDDIGDTLMKQRVKPPGGCSEYDLQLGMLQLFGTFYSRCKAFTDLVYQIGGGGYI